MIIKTSVFLCLFVSMLLLLLYSGDRIYLGILIIFASVFVLCLLSLLYAVLFLRIWQEVTPAIAQKNDKIHYSLKIKNAGIFPVSYVNIHASMPLSEYTNEILMCSFSLMPFGTEEYGAMVDCVYRGTYCFGVRSIELRDVLGFFTLRLPAGYLKIKGKCELTILPKLRNMETLAAINNDGDGEKISGVSDEPDTDLRGWTPGDPLGSIHWKLSVRLGEFLARDRRKNTQPESYLFINTTPHGKTGLDALALEDALVEYAISYVNIVLNESVPLCCTFYTDRRIVLLGDSPLSFESFYKPLSLIDFQSEFTLQNILGNELAAAAFPRTIAVITPPPDSELAGILSGLSEMGHSVYAAIVSDTRYDAAPDAICRKMTDAGVLCELFPVIEEPYEPLAELEDFS